jgi:hypothetical protein
MVYAPKAVVRTGTVRSSTIKQMEALNMDRAAPMIMNSLLLAARFRHF